jgi:hypothetical protein
VSGTDRGLHLLIRLAQGRANECRGKLGEARLAKAGAEAELAAHRDRVASEGRVAVNDPAILAALGAWYRHQARARATLLALAVELDRNEAAARDALQAAYVDLKRLEMAQDNALRRERSAAMRRIEMRADETYASARAFAAD